MKNVETGFIEGQILPLAESEENTHNKICTTVRDNGWPRKRARFGYYCCASKTPLKRVKESERGQGCTLSSPRCYPAEKSRHQNNPTQCQSPPESAPSD